MSSKPFFRFSSDESSLHSFFSSVEDRLNRYDTLFAQQNEKISTLTAQMKIQTEKNQTFSRIQTDTNDLNNRLKLIEQSVLHNNESIQKITSDFSSLSNTINSQLLELSKKVEEKLKESHADNGLQFDDLFNKLTKHTKELVDDSIASINNKVEDFSHLITNIDEDTKKNNTQIININSQINENQKNIQMIRESFLSLNTDSKKQNDLTPLTTTASHIINQFSTIFLAINEIKTSLLALQSRPVEPDLSGLSLRPDQTNILYDFSQPPYLPKLYKFNKISQAVDYIYDLVPALQTYMNAIYSIENSKIKLRENEKDNDQKERDKQFSEIRYEIADIRSLMTNMATRDDINIIQRQRSSRGGGINMSSFNSMDCSGLAGPSNGGFGGSSAIKCIACGRELPPSNSNGTGYNGYNIRQSLSSSTFPDEFASSSSYVSLSMNQPPVTPPQIPRRKATTAANGSRKFNVGIVENPRSARAYHASNTCRKIQTPTTNPKS